MTRGCDILIGAGTVRLGGPALKFGTVAVDALAVRPTSQSRRSGGFWPVAPPRSRVQLLAALPVMAALALFALVRGTRVPLLGWLDLAVHEFGHVATAWLPEAVNLAMGSVVQAGLPLGIAAGLWWRSHDPLGAGLALGWAATSLQDASTYIADAPFQRLPLIGGVHDWGTLLGPAHLDAMWAADDLAALTWALGLCTWLAGVALLARQAWRDPAGRGSRVTSHPADTVTPCPPSWSTPLPTSSASTPRDLPPRGW